MQTTPSKRQTESRNPWRRFTLLSFGAVVACNAVLGIDEAELVCVGAICPDAGNIGTNIGDLDQAPSVDAGPGVASGGSNGSGGPALGGAPNDAGSGVDGSTSPIVPGMEIAPSPCQGRPSGDAFCDGALRIGCGQNGAVIGMAPCGSVALCLASRGGTCTSCLAGEARCDGGTPACAPEEVNCRGARLERCNADRTAFETIDCGAPQRCNEAAGRCNVCEPNAPRCPDGATAAVCNSDGSGETLTPCGLLSRCVAGQCEVLGVPR